MSERILTLGEIEELAELLNKKYAAFIGSRSFSISFDIVKKEGVVSVIVLLSNQDESYYYPVEAYVKYEEEELGAREAVLFLIDYIDLYFDEFFAENEELYIPIDWAKHEYEAVSFHLKGQIINRVAENLASEMLENEKPTILQ